MKGIVWFRSDLRIDDNPALNAALSNCDEVLAIYIFSQSQWEIHNESNIKQEFLFNNLTELKGSLENLNIPLIAINADSYKTLPQDLSSFAVEQKIEHVFCNNEFGFNETVRDQNSKELLKKNNIQFSSFNTAESRNTPILEIFFNQKAQVAFQPT
jgi:deoxyribodipyrimidine photo-lyase